MLVSIQLCVPVCPPPPHSVYKVDTFIVEAVTLQELKRLVIGHDGVGHGAGVYIDKVVVRETEGEAQEDEVVFPCGQWLDDHEGDKLTERELRSVGKCCID